MLYYIFSDGRKNAIGWFAHSNRSLLTPIEQANTLLHHVMLYYIFEGCNGASLKDVDHNRLVWYNGVVIKKNETQRSVLKRFGTREATKNRIWFFQVPISLLQHQRSLGINNSDLRFILGVMMCQLLEQTPTFKNLAMPRLTVVRVRSRLVKKGLLSKGPGNITSVSGSYDLDALFKKLDELQGVKADEPSADDDLGPPEAEEQVPDIQVPKKTEEPEETMDQFYARIKTQHEHYAKIRARRENHALPEAEICIKTDAEPG